VLARMLDVDADQAARPLRPRPRAAVRPAWVRYRSVVLRCCLFLKGTA
jgi:hypothetical protein